MGEPCALSAVGARCARSAEEFLDRLPDVPGNLLDRGLGLLGLVDNLLDDILPGKGDLRLRGRGLVGKGDLRLRERILPLLGHVQQHRRGGATTISLGGVAPDRVAELLGVRELRRVPLVAKLDPVLPALRGALGLLLVRVSHRGPVVLVGVEHTLPPVDEELGLRIRHEAALLLRGLLVHPSPGRILDVEEGHAEDLDSLVGILHGVAKLLLQLILGIPGDSLANHLLHLLGVEGIALEDAEVLDVDLAPCRLSDDARSEGVDAARRALRNLARIAVEGLTPDVQLLDRILALVVLHGDGPLHRLSLGRLRRLVVLLAGVQAGGRRTLAAELTAVAGLDTEVASPPGLRGGDPGAEVLLPPLQDGATGVTHHLAHAVDVLGPVHGVEHAGRVLPGAAGQRALRRRRHVLSKHRAHGSRGSEDDLVPLLGAEEVRRLASVAHASQPLHLAVRILGDIDARSILAPHLVLGHELLAGHRRAAANRVGRPTRGELVAPVRALLRVHELDRRAR
mmetsp:Transcript_106808/g.229959  ORF Transcript_106808/g.229959 Transcript_106808/m.229959 type:complete len:511 (-) Transcript_106808:1581-3113(-)